MTSLIGLFVIAFVIVATKNIFGPKKYEKYDHHGAEVWVRSDLKGKHRNYCLCWHCSQLHPGEARNCVTPVWECPHFTAIVKK